MSDAWKSYRGAPSVSTALCHLSELEDSSVVCLDTDGFPILLLRKGDEVHAYVNACPHQFLPLDHKGNRLLSEDGKVIRCTNHGAGFLAATGEGVEGLGVGECLDGIPVEVMDDTVVIAG